LKAALAALMLALAVLGCASTHITSEANVTAQGATYDTVMVISLFGDLDMVKLGESEMKAHLSGRHVVGIGSTEVFFPGDSYTAEDAMSKLAGLHIQGILVLEAAESTVPPTYYTQGTAWASDMAHPSSEFNHASGSAKFRAELIDMRTEHTVWIATANSGETHLPVPALTEHASGHTLLRSFCGQVMNKLIEDGVLKSPPPKPSPARPTPPKHSSSKHDAHGSITS
jgi:hypothetical protein